MLAWLSYSNYCFFSWTLILNQLSFCSFIQQSDSVKMNSTRLASSTSTKKSLIQLILLLVCFLPFVAAVPMSDYLALNNEPTQWVYWKIWFIMKGKTVWTSIYHSVIGYYCNEIYEINEMYNIYLYWTI